MGTLLYEMLHGLPPFYSQNVAEMYEKIQNERLVFPKHFQPHTRSFLGGLLERDPALRFDVGQIKSHPFFEEINWASVSARTQRVPWSDEILQELNARRIDESLEERKTAAQALGSALQGAEMDTVSNFDFVSPRAIMEEYIENVYQLRTTLDES